MKVKVQTIDGKAGTDIDLNDDVFGVDPRAESCTASSRGSSKSVAARLAPPANAATSPAPARSSVARRAAVPRVTAIGPLRSSSAVVRRMAPVPAPSATR